MAGLEALQTKLGAYEVSGGAIISMLQTERIAYLDKRFLLFHDIASELDNMQLCSPLDESARHTWEIIRSEYRNHDLKVGDLSKIDSVRSIMGGRGRVSSGNTTCNPNMNSMVTIDGIGGRVRISQMGVKGDMRSGPYTTRLGKLRVRPDGTVEDTRTGTLIEKLPREGLPDVRISDIDAQVTIGGRMVLNYARQFEQECAQEWHMDWADQRAELVANFIQWPAWVREGKVSKAIWRETLSRMVASFNIEPMYFVFMSYDLGFRYAFPFFERFLDRGKNFELSHKTKIDTTEDMTLLMQKWLGDGYRENVSLLGNMLQMFRLRDVDVVE